MRLGDVLDVQHGYAFEGQHFTDDPSFPTIVTPGNFAVGGGFTKAKPKTYSGVVPAGFEFTAGDLMITMTDLSKAGDTLGNWATVPDDGQRYLHNQRIGKVLVIRPDLIVGKYLLYRTCCGDYRNFMITTATGTTVRHTSPSRIKNFQLDLPPLPEQQAIAEVLGALDDKIAANRALVTTSDQLAQTLTAEALGESSPTSLDQLSSITMGSSPKGTSYNDDGEGEVLFQGMRDFSTRFPVPRVWTTQPVRMAASGDLLMSVRAPVGTLNVADRPCCIGRGLAALHTEWTAALFHLLTAQPELFTSFNSDGTIFGSINKVQLNALPVLVPLNGLHELEAKLAPLEVTIRTALRESATLASLRDTLLPALMDGTIRVKDAITKAEEVL